MNKQQTGEHCKGRYPHITYITVRDKQHNIIRILNKAGKLLYTDVTTEELDLMKKKKIIFVNKKVCHIFFNGSKTLHEDN